MAKWLQRSWRATLLTGIGALLSPLGLSGSKASNPPDGRNHYIIVKREHGVLLMSERGHPFESLELGDTPEAREFNAVFDRLSPDGSAVRVPVDRRIVADGGMGVAKSTSAKKQKKASSERT
jgi:hypothetical protein